MAISFLDFFGSDLSKMDQTCKFGEQTSRILEFQGLISILHKGLRNVISSMLLIRDKESQKIKL